MQSVRLATRLRESDPTVAAFDDAQAALEKTLRELKTWSAASHNPDAYKPLQADLYGAVRRYTDAAAERIGPRRV
jgi:hypothetical protein